MDTPKAKPRFQFHLSTLLLISICVGSVIGLWTRKDVWLQEERIETTPQNEMLVNSSLQKWVPNRPNIVGMHPDSNPDYSRLIADKEVIEVFGKYAKISKRIDIDSVSSHPEQVIDLSNRITAAYLSEDTNHLVLRNSESMYVFRRSRDYGNEVILSMVALLSSLAVAFIFLRFMYLRLIPPPTP